MQKKSPVLAAVLGFIFGPLGYFYIGWRYAIIALVVFSIFVVILMATAFPIPSWMKFVILAVLAWKTFTICSIRNHLIETHDEHVDVLNTFPIAAMAMSDLLVGIGMLGCFMREPLACTRPQGPCWTAVLLVGFLCSSLVHQLLFGSQVWYLA